MTSKPSLIEYSGLKDGRDYTRGFVNAFYKWLPTQDSLLNLKSGGDLELYEQVAQDDQVKSCLQQRFRALLSKDWEVVPGGDKRIDKAAAEHLEKQLNDINWDDCNEKMLWGLLYGYSAAEILWKREGDKVGIAAIKVRNRRRFHFDADQQLVLKTMQNPLGEDLPERKFWHFCTGADHDDEPYGRGLGHWLYWPTFFKRNGVRWWLKFVEKYAQPTRLGKYPAGATQGEKDTLWNALGSFGDDARSMIPEGLEMEFLESSRAGTVDYKALCDQMDAAIAKIILSQTMTTDNGSSRSQAEVHEGVKDEVIESDSDLLCESFNNSVVTWLTDWNFPDAAYPKVRRKIQADPDPATMAETDTKLQGLGISLKPEAIAAKYGEDYVVIDKNASPQMTEGQVNALSSIVTSAKQGGWPPALLEGMIKVSFPSLSDKSVAAITSNLGDATGSDAALIPTDPQVPTQPPANTATNPTLEDIAIQFAAPAKKKNCKIGISCGNSCISAKKACRKTLSPKQQEIKLSIVSSTKASKNTKAASDIAKDFMVEEPFGDADIVAQYGISPQENLALSSWISGSGKYRQMNKLLYSGSVDEEFDLSAVLETNKLAQAALEKLPPVTTSQLEEIGGNSDYYDNRRPLKRFIVNNNKDFLQSYKNAVGTSVVEPTFFATTTKNEFIFGSGNIVYEITPKMDGSGKAKSIDRFTGVADEGEVLYPPNVEFNVLAVEPGKKDGYWIIKLKEK